MCVCAGSVGMYLYHGDDVTWVEEVENTPVTQLVPDLDTKHQTHAGKQESLAQQVLMLGEGFGHGEGPPGQGTDHHHYRG